MATKDDSRGRSAATESAPRTHSPGSQMNPKAPHPVVPRPRTHSPGSQTPPSLPKNPGTQPAGPLPGPGKRPGTGSKTNGKITDGVFLVNSERNGKWTSGFAWYPDIDIVVPGLTPGAYVDVKKDGVVTWEGHMYQATFPDGNIFTVTIKPNAHDASLPTGAVVGTARNKFKVMVVYKDIYTRLYEVGSWQVYSVYYCV